MGRLLCGGLLTFYAVECLSIASDQWFGARADASQPDLASTALVGPFLALGVALTAAVVWHLHHLDRAE